MVPAVVSADEEPVQGMTETPSEGQGATGSDTRSPSGRGRDAVWDELDEVPVREPRL